MDWEWRLESKMVLRIGPKRVGWNTWISHFFPWDNICLWSIVSMTLREWRVYVVKSLYGTLSVGQIITSRVGDLVPKDPSLHIHTVCPVRSSVLHTQTNMSKGKVSVKSVKCYFPEICNFTTWSSTSVCTLVSRCTICTLIIPIKLLRKSNWVT